MKLRHLLILLNTTALALLIGAHFLIRNHEAAKAARYAAPSNTLAEQDPAPSKSLGQLPDFQLINQQGHPYGSVDLRKHIWIATFIFTRCQLTCPVQTEKMFQIQERLRSLPLFSSIRFVSITIDPEHDTASVLKDYAVKNGASDNWVFLTGERDEIWKLSRAGFHLGVGESESDAPFMHSPKFIVLDRDLQLRGYFDSDEQSSIDQLIEEVARLAAE